MYRPKHRALQRRRPTAKHAPMAAVGTLTLAMAAVFGPTAYADTDSIFSHQPNGPKNGQQGQGKPDKPDKPDKPGKPEDEDETEHDPGATNGGHALLGDAGLSLAGLKPTAQPVTPYEMPFPCGEVWSGSTRNGHTPSVRSVDFNRSGDLGLPVVAAAPGTVVTSVVGAKKPSYGQYVVIDHGNNESTLYAHLDSVLVTVGQAVSAGTQLGTVGDTGNSRGSHLHFEERLAGAVVDAWFHGALMPRNSSQESQNCGTAPVIDIPLAGNLYGTKAAEMMVFRKANPAAYHVTRLGKGEQVITIGTATDQPVLGDWDGNGRLNPGVRTPSTRTFELRVRGKDQTIKFGKQGDLPAAGNWDGVGAWEVGVRRPGSAKFLLRAADGTVTKVALGDADDLPVTGDWNADGVTDLGVFDRATAVFTLRTLDLVGVEVLTTVQFGTPGAEGVLPVVGDWDGNGVTDLGTWNPATLTFYQRNAPSPRSTNVKLGRALYRAGELPRSSRSGR